MIYDKDWNVEAAQIIADWAGKEEYHKTIIGEIGMNCILDSLSMEPQALIRPLMGLVLSRLIQKDSTKQLIVQQGGISGLTALVTINAISRDPAIFHFVSRSMAMIAKLVTGIPSLFLSPPPFSFPPLLILPYFIISFLASFLLFFYSPPLPLFPSPFNPSLFYYFFPSLPFLFSSSPPFSFPSF